VPTGFLAPLRQCQRPLIAVAIGLVVLQTLAAGLSAAQAAALIASGPFGAICHGTGEGDTAPAPGKAWDACCALCAVAAPALLPVAPPAAGDGDLVCAGNRVSAASPDIVLIARRAVRAGPSQAPPGRA
jgi:hypothetical protein